MAGLVQVIYHSTATAEPSDDDLERLLTRARETNARLGVTGILLYCERTYFQVLEGDPEVVDALMLRIASDRRHADLVTIVREPVARRSFADWTMGYARLSRLEVGEIAGTSDFFDSAASLDKVGPGRARKLLAAFREGRWRSRLAGQVEPPAPDPGRDVAAPDQVITFAFQPIVDVVGERIVSYEALVRGAANEPAAHVLQRVPPLERHGFDERCRAEAVGLAARLGLRCDLNLNFLPLCVKASTTSITATLAAARRWGIDPGRIVLEILESEIFQDYDGFARAVNEHRGLGLRTAIDDFGAGYAGLALLAELMPDAVKLDRGLVHSVASSGPRQAVIRGVLRTCLDLGVDVVAEGVETPAELAWLRAEGITLFQGHLFASPAFQSLPPARWGQASVS